MAEYIVDRENIYPYGSQHEEIVRCRDCEHYDHGRCWSDQWSTASLMPAHHVEPGGFCSWGERKGE